MSPRWHRLTEVRDLFVADAWSDTDLHFGSRMAFGPEGMLYMTMIKPGRRVWRSRGTILLDARHCDFAYDVLHW